MIILVIFEANLKTRIEVTRYLLMYNQAILYSINKTDTDEHSTYESKVVGYKNFNIVSLQERNLFY